MGFCFKTIQSGGKIDALPLAKTCSDLSELAGGPFPVVWLIHVHCFSAFTAPKGPDESARTQSPQEALGPGRSPPGASKPFALRAAGHGKRSGLGEPQVLKVRMQVLVHRARKNAQEFKDTTYTIEAKKGSMQKSIKWFH